MNSLSQSGRRDDRRPQDMTPRADALARGLGWFSIAIGVAEMIAPRAVSRIAGVHGHAGLTRLYGLRELACGIGILASRKPVPFMWARVAGDALDLGTLAVAPNRSERRAGATAMNLACVAALDLYAAKQLSMNGDTAPQATRDYANRTGFPGTAAQMRGAALADFTIPRDMRTPDALAPFTRDRERTAQDERSRAGSSLLSGDS